MRSRARSRGPTRGAPCDILSRCDPLSQWPICLQSAPRPAHHLRDALVRTPIDRPGCALARALHGGLSMNAPQAHPPSAPRLLVLPGGRAGTGEREGAPAPGPARQRRTWPRTAARWLLVAVAAVTCPVYVTAVVLLVVLCAGPLLDGGQEGGAAGGDRLSHRGSRGLRLLRH